jgi:hypothetical protein
MRFSILFFASLLLSFHSLKACAEMTSPRFPSLAASAEAVQLDLDLILKKAQLPKGTIRWERTPPSSAIENTQALENQVHVVCPTSQQWVLQISGPDQEWGPTFYYGLQKLGFLFPHPRWQISPHLSELARSCGQTWTWKPRLQYRGFHFHMQHPNEWVHGLVREEFETLQKNLAQPLQLAKELGIHSGLNVSFVSIQQKSLYLATPLLSLESFQTRMIRTASRLITMIPFDFLSVDMGSTEFTPSSFTETLEWINAVDSLLKRAHRQLFIKAHVSIAQTDPHFGNFNFLTQWSSAEVGVLPHSVLDFSLQDASAPVYGRKNLQDMKEFLLKEVNERPTWYFPETSYFIGMDIDVPLFLTDYLVARSQDMDFLEDHHVQGQLNFTTGQELGYWLMDWSVALFANSEYRRRPLAALELLGEDVSEWQKIIDFQTKYFKNEGLLSILSSSSLLDEIPFMQPIFERVILRRLKDDLPLVRSQKALLDSALRDLPDLGGIKNPELKSLLETTWDRIHQAYWLRCALEHPFGSQERNHALDQAKAVRVQARNRMSQFVQQFSRYPEALIFEPHSNPTSYPFGYGWPAKTLHFWEREEKMIRKQDYSPWFMNIYNVVDLLT